jgi:lipid-A-disaccharide synthase-like uncharacterized protein
MIIVVFANVPTCVAASPKPESSEIGDDEALSGTRVSIRYSEPENHRHEHLASWIFLGIGFLGQFLFGVRFFLQWIASERKRAVVIPRAFWWFSIGGAIATGIYSVSILAYPIILSQGVNCLIYSRSLYLSYEKKDDHEISASKIIE